MAADQRVNVCKQACVCVRVCVIRAGYNTTEYWQRYVGLAVRDWLAALGQGDWYPQ